MNRYLLNISYIGTKFRGIQKTVNKFDESRLDTTTVQGCIEMALQVLRPKNEIKTVLSSRTDAGVHALDSTVHVDLERDNSELFDTTAITGVLNRTFDKQKLPIRILKTQHVPQSFNCRYSALGRTYLYRFAVAKHGIDETARLKNRNFEVFLPIEEIDRCYFLQNSNFDVERCRSATRLFLGRHDFRTFMNVSRQKSKSRDSPMFTVRTLDEINLRPGRSLGIHENADRAAELYNYWDIEIKGKSFLYKQVRRMVGAWIAFGTGLIDEKCLYVMLTVPSKHSWSPNVLVAPPFGLFLKKVHYDPKEFEFAN